MARRKSRKPPHRAAQPRHAPDARQSARAGDAGRARRSAAGLANIRDSIDAIDARIHALLNERARFAQLVGISKSASRQGGGFLSPGTRGRGAAHGAQAQSGTAARRGNRALVPRNHVGLPGAAGAAEGGLPGSGGHVHPGRRAQAFRLLGAGAAAAGDRRGIPRSRRRHRRLRRRAHRELQRGHGQSHAGHVPDLRRSRSAAKWNCASIII